MRSRVKANKATELLTHKWRWFAQDEHGDGIPSLHVMMETQVGLVTPCRKTATRWPKPAFRTMDEVMPLGKSHRICYICSSDSRLSKASPE